jgi:hypothetical protein
VGYDATNLRRIMRFTKTHDPQIMGSCVGMTTREVALVARAFSQLGFDGVAPELDNVSGGALAFLRERCPFD